MATHNGGNRHLRRALRVGLMTFLGAAGVAWLSQTAMRHSGLAISLVVLVFIVMIGVVADMIGTAVAAADETPFHAMAAKRLFGARQALWLVKNDDRVSNFFGDIVGDIAGTISGAAAASIALVFFGLVRHLPVGSIPWMNELFDILAVAVVSALAVGGKAAGKGLALSYPTAIVLRVGVGLAWLEKVLPWKITNGKPRKPSRGRTNP